MVFAQFRSVFLVLYLYPRLRMGVGHRSAYTFAGIGEHVKMRSPGDSHTRDVNGCLWCQTTESRHNPTTMCVTSSGGSGGSNSSRCSGLEH